MQKVLLNDIVQFRLIEIDNKKIPILVDEATPHQREEYHGVDPLVTVTGTSVIRLIVEVRVMKKNSSFL